MCCIKQKKILKKHIHIYVMYGYATIYAMHTKICI